ncbi:nucleotidyltransferase family protein [Niveibacterium sp.]|uniref:nucleotidyltransferase family protein n=1 Tax=Niveibacterium sp. TaxID=2017444 RepID=UPI0035B4B848
MMNSLELAGIDALILAGGLGTRLRSVVADRQKAFANVANEPFAARIFRQLRRAGVRRIVFALGHLAESAAPILDQWRCERGPEILASVESTPLGTGGALRHALPLLRSSTVLVLNGDSYVDADLAALLATHRAARAAITLSAVQVTDVSRYGALEFDRDGRHVSAFHEKQASGGCGWINAGIYLIEREVLAAIPEACAVSLEREVFPLYTDGRIAARCESRPFIDIGTPETYAAGADFFARVA